MVPKKKLVIVESPSKIKSIKKILGDEFEVDSSYGHIRDLPQPSELPAKEKKGPFGKFAVNVENKFEPYYVVSPDKKKKVAELKKALKEADELYLATDRDREGEAIAWHLKEVLKPKVPVKRMVFGDITPESINEALENTRDIDIDLVNAQETRRVLDRLYGYEVSPVLWRKVRSGISAGRVQSVATRLIVQRERERMAYVTANYWDLVAHLKGANQEFTAKLTELNTLKVATGKDFNEKGKLTSNTTHLDEEAAQALADGLQKSTFTVSSLETKPYSRKPAAPFTTSTLQQEAARKLRFSSRVTMMVAQTLYEQGYITYMRTDSPALSSQATKAAREQASQMFGKESLAPKPRKYSSKSSNAQEAHEAIRPAGETFRTPKELRAKLNNDQIRLYELIWKRTVASQMADAKGSTATMKLYATSTNNDTAVFSTSGTVITFRGFLAAYEEGNDKESTKDSKENRLPQLKEGDTADLLTVNAEGHDTTPPARYTEASLIKTLDEKDIGRPSTYTSIISTIMDRGYVYKRNTALVPSWLAFAVVRLLEDHFENIVEYDFSAAMEADLDRIASGEENKVDWLSHFYLGKYDNDSLTETRGLRNIVDNLGEIDAKDINTIPISDTIDLRVGRYGPYIEKLDTETGELVRASVPDTVAPDELTVEKAEELFKTQPEGDKELGKDPESGNMIVAKSGRFGPYITEIMPEDSKSKARTASLFKTMSLDTVTFEEALKLLSLPRVLGKDPHDGIEITAQNGRFGPYLKKDKDSRTLESEEQIFNITLDEAVKIYEQPKTRRRGAAKPPLKEFGIDPSSEKKIVVKDGRFGAYITDGITNITVPKTETIESLTEGRAIELLAEKRAKGPTQRKTTRKKTTAKKANAKKTTAARSRTTKKSTTKK
ncbi:MAG: type I DNA topoisomerase [Micrococcaceae bacterium]